MHKIVINATIVKTKHNLLSVLLYMYVIEIDYKQHGSNWSLQDDVDHQVTEESSLEPITP